MFTCIPNDFFRKLIICMEIHGFICVGDLKLSNHKRLFTNTLSLLLLTHFHVFVQASLLLLFSLLFISLTIACMCKIIFSTHTFINQFIHFFINTLLLYHHDTFTHTFSHPILLFSFLSLKCFILYIFIHSFSCVAHDFGMLLIFH